MLSTPDTNARQACPTLSIGLWLTHRGRRPDPSDPPGRCHSWGRLSSPGTCVLPRPGPAAAQHCALGHPPEPPLWLHARLQRSACARCPAGPWLSWVSLAGHSHCSGRTAPPAPPLLAARALHRLSGPPPGNSAPGDTMKRLSGRAWKQCCAAPHKGVHAKLSMSSARHSAPSLLLCIFVWTCNLCVQSRSQRTIWLRAAVSRTAGSRPACRPEGAAAAGEERVCLPAACLELTAPVFGACCTILGEPPLLGPA